MPSFTEVVEGVGLAVDGAGVFVIVFGVVAASVRFLTSRFKGAGTESEDAYRQFRHDLGRGILLGLEFLVAADIIRTVAVAPTLENVTVLGLIVLIRTFLSLALQVELEGHWPWQRAGDPAAGSKPRV